MMPPEYDILRGLFFCVSETLNFQNRQLKGSVIAKKSYFRASKMEK